MNITTMRKELREGGWEYVPGKGWAMSKDIVEDSTGDVQYYDLESAHDIEMEARRQKAEFAN